MQSFVLEERHAKVTDALEKGAMRHIMAITSIALSYKSQKAPYVFPIVGGRKGDVEALGVDLSKEDFEEIESAVPLDIDFALSFLGMGPGGTKGPGDVWLIAAVGNFELCGGGEGY